MSNLDQEWFDRMTESRKEMVRDLHSIRDIFRGLVDDMNQRITRLEGHAEARAKSRQSR